MNGTVEIQKLRLEGLLRTLRALLDHAPQGTSVENLGQLSVKLIEGMLAGPEVAATLSKRPVAFRVHRRDGVWELLESEQEAADLATIESTEYQGLYARDGT